MLFLHSKAILAMVKPFPFSSYLGRVFTLIGSLPIDPCFRLPLILLPW